MILLLLMLFMRKRVALTVALFAVAGKVFVQLPLLSLQPFVTFAALLLFWSYWSLTLLFLGTSGNPVQNEETGLTEFRLTGPLQYLTWYHAVGLVWITEFILACQQMTVAGAVVTYYFTRDKNRLPVTPILSSVLRLVRYHLGTVAKGAFIITLVKIPRLILMYLHNQLKGKRTKREWRPLEDRSSTDLPWFLLFAVFCVGMGSICGFSVVTGGAARLVFGYDSYGNTCGRRNDPIEGVRLSGLDHTDRKSGLFLSLPVCVQEFVESSRRLGRAAERGRSRVKEAAAAAGGAEMKPMVSHSSCGVESVGVGLGGGGGEWEELQEFQVYYLLLGVVLDWALAPPGDGGGLALCLSEDVVLFLCIYLPTSTLFLFASLLHAPSPAPGTQSAQSAAAAATS
ncbi:choline transporter-like protein 1 [Etheostoma cragini]|uniref:choline transporter-like protein 1 n=1 Tax=Etheostoma cragini TaxID=417921 RepID=UPI00155EA5EB|nr:choline transporter-like protein 1 [Etheostoma cragini]